MSIITASLTTEFVDEDETGELPGILHAEWDTRTDGLNNGKTSFRPGDSRVFLEFASSNVTVTNRLKTAGALASAGSGSFLVGTDEQRQWLDFDIDNQIATLQYPISSGFTYTWHGASLGTPQVIDYGTKIKVAIDPSNTTALGVLEVRYTAQYRAWRLANVPTTVNRVRIKLLGTRS